MTSFYIPGNVPSFKNGASVYNGHHVKSKSVQNYLKHYSFAYLAHARTFRAATAGLPKPLYIGFKFFRDTRRRFDYINACQGVQDLMVEHGWIDDDNADEIVPIFPSYVYKKNEGGVEIIVYECNPL